MDAEKEFFRLWWEYLRRSDNYKNYCEKYGTHEQYYDPDLDYTFGENGNIWICDFEDWYQGKLHPDGVTYTWSQPFDNPPQKVGEATPTTKVEYAQGYILESLQTAGDRLRAKLNREPSLKEFQDYYSSERGVYQDISMSAFVVEPVLEKSNKDTIGEIKKSLKGTALRKKTIKHDELQKYLDVFDLFEDGETIHSVIRKHEIKAFGKSSYDPDTSESADTLQREYRRYYSKAKRIIQNTEQNRFPGEY